MASSFQFGFAAPENFSDWASYAGLDRKTGMMAPPAPTQEGVKPPETMSEMFQQKVVQPLQNTANKIQQFGTSVQNALPTFQQNAQAAQQNVQSTGWQLHGLIGD